MQRLKSYLLWLTQCLLTGSVVPRKKRVVVKNFTDRLQFGYRLNRVAVQGRKDGVKTALNG